MGATFSVFEFFLVGYRRTWRGSLLSSFVLPLLTMLGFGLGVGAYVTGGVQGVSYLDWVVPGLIASTAVQVAMGDSTWPVLGGFTWTRGYYGQASAPLRVTDILDGHLLFIVFRTIITSAAFLLVASLFGTMHSWWALATVPIAAVIGLAVATPTFAYSATVRTDSYLAILFRVGVIPMSLFSGVFFPIASVPAPLRWIAYVLPLWHGVDLNRAATLGIAPSWPVAAHLAYLGAWCSVGWWLAYRRFRSRLTV